MDERERSGGTNFDKTNNGFAVSAPTISLPKSGGAISGIGEKSAANPVTRTASLTVSFDALGHVAGTATVGKSSATLRDSVVGFTAGLAQAQIDTFFGTIDPHPTAATLLGGATTRIVYDVDRFRTTQAANPDAPTPMATDSCRDLGTGDTFERSASTGGGLTIQLSFGASDGFSREIQKKANSSLPRFSLQRRRIHG
jgi:hypothetical protein